MSIPDHLSESCRKIVESASQEARIAIIGRDIFVRHEATKTAIEELLDLVSPGRGHGSTGALIFGDPGMGKTELLKALGRSLVSDKDDDRSAPVDLIVYEPLWESAHETLLIQLSKLLGIRVEREGPDLRKIAETLEAMKIAALCIEDIHDLFLLPKAKLPLALQVLRKLVNHIKIPCICTAISDSLIDFASDKQIGRRLDLRLYLPAWKSGPSFDEFLLHVEAELPLRRPSNLKCVDTAKWLIGTCQSTDGIMKAIRKAAIESIKTGEECVSLATLKKVVVPFAFSKRAQADSTSRNSDTQTAEGSNDVPKNDSE